MSGLFGRLFGSSAAPAVAGFRVQTSVYGLPIPVIYGRARVAGNMLILLDQSQQPVSVGGKAASKSGQVQTNSRAAIGLALCEGPIAGIRGVWADKDGVRDFTSYFAPAGWSLFLGTSTQSPWSYVSTFHPAQAIPYQFLAYVAIGAIDMPSGVLPNYSWEIDGFLPVGGIVDAHPKAILVDVVTDVSHGLGIPSSIFGDLSAYQDFCTAAGLFVSPAYTAIKPATDHLAELFDASVSAPVWSDGVLKVIPYADAPITGNSVTYTPNTTPLYDLTDDHFLRDGTEDPVRLVRKRSAEAYNQIFVEYEERTVNGGADYRPLVAEAKDQASLELGIFRPASKIQLPLIKDGAIARLVAQYKLQRELNVRNAYQFRLSWKFALLEPMDLVTLTDAALGLSFTPVRITEVTEAEDGIEVTAEDWPFGTASATRYASQSGSGNAPSQGIDPGNTSTPVIFEGPLRLADDPLELWLAASGGANWGGCEVYVSTDGVRYYKVGAIGAKCSFGVLSAALGAGPALPAIDSSNTLSVDITASGGALAAGASGDAAALLTLCYVDGEYLAFETETLLSAGHYALGTLGRGGFRTTALWHPSGSAFVRCDDNVLRLPYPQGVNGQLLYFKLPAFNAFGRALQDIATVPAFTHTIQLIGRAELLPFTRTGTETTETFAWTRNAATHAVWVYDTLLKVGDVDPYDSGTALPVRVLTAGVDAYTAQKPLQGFASSLHFVPMDLNGRPGVVRHEGIVAAPSGLSGKITAVRTNGTADLTLSITGTAPNWPVGYVLHDDTPDGAVILSGSVSANTTIGPADAPVLAARALPLREMHRWYMTLTDVGGLTVIVPGMADRDPLAVAAATRRDYRLLPQIIVSYDTDTDSVRITLPDGRTKTFAGLTGSGSVAYTVGDVLDDASTENAFATDEERGVYVVAIQGGSVWTEISRGQLHGTPSKHPIAQPRLVLSANRDTADAYVKVTSPTGEALGVSVRDAESSGAPEYVLCVSSSDPTPLYVASGTEVGPTNWFTYLGVQTQHLAAIALTRDQIKRLYLTVTGKDSGVQGTAQLVLSTKEQPWLESIAALWNGGAGTYDVTLVGGANCASALIEIADNASFTSPRTSSGSLTDGGTDSHSFSLTGTDLGKIWYARGTPNNAAALGGLNGVAQQDSDMIPQTYSLIMGIRQATPIGGPYTGLDVNFTHAGFPTGTTFDVSYNNGVAGGLDAKTVAISASPMVVSFTGVTFAGTPGSGLVTIVAKDANGNMLGGPITRGKPPYTP